MDHELIKSTLSKHPKVSKVDVRTLTKVVTFVDCDDKDLPAVREEIYKLEIELFKAYPDALFDFYVQKSPQ